MSEQTFRSPGFFEQEIEPTIELVKSVIKKVNAKG
jgi:hypothetical protein